MKMLQVINFTLIGFLLFSDFNNVCLASTIDFEQIGGIPNNGSIDIAWRNGALLNNTMKNLGVGDVFLIPNKTFHLMGGIKASGLQSVIFIIDGTLVFSNKLREWPRDGDGRVLDSFHFYNFNNVTFTSNGKGTLDGNGERWWGIPGIGYLLRPEPKPRLFNIDDSSNILVEKILFIDSPDNTFWARRVKGLEVRYCDISARRTSIDDHDLIDLTAFYTDGFDITGRDVWIHDCSIWNQDDCIAVKDDSQNMLFERINASGLGLTIGSIGNSVVNNITFRDSYMHHTFKGIYLKFRNDDINKGGRVSNILYENIYMDSPKQWSIWIGPAQQAVSRRLCSAHPCSICWPELEEFGAKCEMPSNFIYENITLKDVTIVNPRNKYGAGVILGNSTTPMKGLIFDNVQIISNDTQFSEYYTCEGVSNAKAVGNTNPVPYCFDKNTYV